MMPQSDIDKLSLAETDYRDLSTGKIARYDVTGLASDLQAQIHRGQFGCIFHLTQHGRQISIYPPAYFPEPEGALEDLKRYLASH